MCQDSSQDHVTTQAPPLRQSRDTFGGVQQLQKCFVTNIQNKASLRKTTHLKKVRVENTCVNVAYISDTKYKIITTVIKMFQKHFVNVPYIYLYIYYLYFYI